MSEEFKPFATVKVSKIRRVIAAWEAIKGHTKDEDGDIDMTMEYLIVSCFPDLWKNFQNNIRDQYTKGYMEGFKEGQLSMEENNESDT